MNALTLSFTLCALAFAALALVALTIWRERVAGSRLTAAFVIEAAWAAMLAVLAGGERALPVSLVVAVEVTRGLAWLLVLLAALAPVFSRTLPSSTLPTAWVASGLIALAVLLSPLWLPGDAVVAALFDAQRWSGLLIAIAGLVLVEQFARNAREDQRWQLKYIWLGIGLLFALDLGVWSLALLVGSIEGLPWAARGIVNLLVAALMAISLQRVRRWDATLFRSSGAFFFNTTLVFAGGYVLAMALASWLLGASADERSRGIVESAFLGAALVLLAIALFSDQFRAWLRVTLAKYLGRQQYNYRDVWLSLTRALTETSDVPLHERVPTVLAGYVNSGLASLWLRDPGGPYRRAGGALEPAGVVQLEHDAFFDYLRDNDWIYDATNPRPRLAQRVAAPPPPPPPWLAAEPRAWLVVPLIGSDDLVGFLLIGRPMAPTPLGWEQLDLLRAAGRQVAAFLAFEQAATRLAEMHQFEALNRLSGFVMHDLRHLVAQLALVVDNAARHRRNPEFIDDAILTIESSVKRMNGLMDVLRAGVVREPERRVDLAELARELRERCRGRDPVPAVDADAAGAEVMANRERLLQALEHLVRNAQDATPAGGSVDVRVRRGSRSATLEIVDTGCGMDAEFVRTRLFKPFDTTKGQQGMGLGAYEAREIVRRLGGSLAVDSRPDHGTRLTIELPLAPALEHR
jgi:putative PEP-CTERM system histidine kinase